MVKGKILSKFGSHYAMERFGILFVSLFLCMCLLLASITARKVKSDRRTLSGRAQYTVSMNTSLSNSVGSVHGVYTDRDHTKCFVLWHFDDMSSLPLKSDDYHFYLRGLDSFNNPQKLDVRPTCTFYVFGSTGYMGMYLYRAGGFESQIYQLTMRSMKNISGQSKADQGAAASDAEMYNRYDMCDIFFNPGGSYANRAGFLERDDWSPFDVYGEIIVSPQESNICSMLKQDLIDMNRCRVQWESYADRLTDLGVISSDAPEQIRDDRVYAYETSKLTSGPEELHWSTVESAWMNDDKTVARTNSKVTLFMDTNYVVPKGFNFEWQNVGIRSGYLASLTGSTDLRVWAEYVAGIRAESTYDSFSSDLSNVRWYYSSGAEVDMDALSSVTAIDNDRLIASTISMIENNWSNYYELKRKYQTEHLPMLLDLERDVHSVENSYSVSYDDNGSMITM